MLIINFVVYIEVNRNRGITAQRYRKETFLQNFLPVFSNILKKCKNPLTLLPSTSHFSLFTLYIIPHPLSIIFGAKSGSLISGLCPQIFIFLSDFLRSNKDTPRAACCGYLFYILRIEIYQKSIKKIWGQSPEMVEPCTALAGAA